MSSVQGGDLRWQTGCLWAIPLSLKQSLNSALQCLCRLEIVCVGTAEPAARQEQHRHVLGRRLSREGCPSAGFTAQEQLRERFPRKASRAGSP